MSYQQFKTCAVCGLSTDVDYEEACECSSDESSCESGSDAFISCNICSSEVDHEGGEFLCHWCEYYLEIYDTLKFLDKCHLCEYYTENYAKFRDATRCSDKPIGSPLMFKTAVSYLTSVGFLRPRGFRA